MNPLPIVQLSLPSRRKPHPCANESNAVSCHPMRPDVAAPDHFTHWLTSFGINFMNHLSNSFPPHIIAHDRIVLTQCIKCDTLSNYSASPLCFTQFCDEFTVPEATHMLASESLLCIFITTHGCWPCWKRHTTFLAIRPPIVACYQWGTMEWWSTPLLSR